jgi:hypothetical protein
MADRFGNYETGFTVIAALAFAGSIFFILARKPDPPERPTPIPEYPLTKPSPEPAGDI